MPIYSEFLKSVQDLVHGAKMTDACRGPEKPPAYQTCEQDDASDSRVSKSNEEPGLAPKPDNVWECETDFWGKPCNMSFIFASGKRGEPDYWFGQMWIVADDIPKLMRNGFSYQEANISREEGWIS